MRNINFLESMYTKAVEYGIETEFLKFVDRVDGAKFINANKAYALTGISYIMGINSSAKVIKGIKKDYLTGIVYLAAAKNSGVNTCPKATKGCEKACLFNSGRASIVNDSMNISKVNKGRFFRTVLYYVNRQYFMDWLNFDIKTLKRKGIRENKNVAVRLNGTSDILISQFKVNDVSLLELHNDVQFYDYTKILKQLELSSKYNNYHVTFSYGGVSNLEDTLIAIEKGFNVSVVFDSANFPKSYFGKPVINADETDLRFLDEKGVICGLKLKTPVASKKFKKEQLNNDFVVKIAA